MQSYVIIKKMFKPQFYLLIVFYIYMSLSKPGADLVSSYNDLILHFIGYAVLINSSLLAYGIKSKKINRFIYLFSFSFALEVIQHFIPHREFSFLDLINNGKPMPQDLKSLIQTSKTTFRILDSLSTGLP